MRTDTDSELLPSSAVSNGNRLAKVLGVLLAISIAFNVVIGAYWLTTTATTTTSKEDNETVCKASYVLGIKELEDQVKMRDQVITSIKGEDNGTLTSPITKAYEPSEPYNPNYAKTAALYASAAYCPPQSVRDWSEGFSSALCKALPADSVEIFSSKSQPGWFKSTAFGYVVVDKPGKQIVVAFKGTNGTIGDFIADADSSFSDERSYCNVKGTRLPGQYHPGFCWYYTELADVGLDSAVDKAVAANPDFDLLYTGHSLGGAIAAIGVTDVMFRLKLKPSRTIMYTFGSPRTGNAEFAAYLQDNVEIMYRVTHGKDPVVHLPPCFLKCISGLCPFNTACFSTWAEFSYHVAREVFYDGTGDQAHTVCNGWGEDPACANSQWGISLDDHLQYLGINVGSECCFSEALVSDGTSDASVCVDTPAGSSDCADMMHAECRT